MKKRRGPTFDSFFTGMDFRLIQEGEVGRFMRTRSRYINVPYFSARISCFSDLRMKIANTDVLQS